MHKSNEREKNAKYTHTHTIVIGISFKGLSRGLTTIYICDVSINYIIFLWQFI